ncbi:hypothetical protein BCU71_19065 [Vibrio lentus]|uniref:restriction endonuclease subunit S n=1 Tax=Vibrio lentus TaxID=136468 RepID=UPI000C861C4C|nr:restriction endonuclease subunit S [Vibrio lentus]PMH28841.1 hypothetical protein BCU71_19065 [Vibrio lentus]PMK68496.1 hypothetical protein BCT93_18665 [Vibrio lentus]
MSEVFVDIPNYAGWLNNRIDKLCSLARRGTAPVYVDHSNVKAIGQRCVTHSNFDPSYARPHSEKATSNILKAQLNDVLLNSTGTGTIGRSVIFSESGEFIVDGHVTVLRPHQDLVDSRWLNAVIRSKWFQRHLERFCYTGSTNQLELSRTYLNSSSLPTPTEEEQSKIGDVLEALDTQIYETEAIIAKLQQVKQGLLHDLLTRGVDEYGELRPSYEDAPELYKSSNLGMIPQDWDCFSLGTMADISYGISDAIDTSLTSGVKTITLPCVKPNGQLILDENLLAFTHPNKISGDLLLQKGDLMFNWRNGSQHHLGKTAYFDLDEIYTHVGFLLKIRAKNTICFPLFLYYAMNYTKDCGVFLRSKIQVNNTFNSAELRALMLNFPKKNEQIIIAEKVKSLSDKITAEIETLKKLHMHKSGLIDDLLTGKVRVTELIKQQQTS